MAVPQNIEELAHQVRTAIYGRDVRESIASSMEATADVADWARSVAQAIVDGSFDEATLNTAIENKLTQLEQNYAPTLTAIEAEVTDARGTETNLGNRLENFNAQLAQKATKAGKLFYPEDFGAKGDYDTDTKTGTNDREAIQAAVNAAENAGGGTVVLDAKNYLLEKGVNWRSGVSLIGQGEDRTVLYASGNISAVLWQGGATYHTPERDYNQDNPMRDMTFKNFTINCSEITSGGKGILLFFLKNVLFEDITIIDSPATAMGCDFLADSTMRRITTINAGRMFDTIGIGSSGIGVGTGAWEIENLLVEDCKTIGSGNYGIFFEKQNYASGGVYSPYYSTGMVVRNCVVEGSGVAGIGDNGVDGMVVENTIVRNNNKGIEVLDGGINGRILNCQIHDNDFDGFRFAETVPDGYYIDSNTKIYGNGYSGINLDITNSLTNNFTVNAEIFKNGRNGITLLSPVHGLNISNSKIYNNGQVLSGESNSQNGLVVRADLTQAIISNNLIYDDQTEKTQSNGIRLSAVNVEQSIIKDNIVQNNLISNIDVSAATVSTDSLIKDNIE